MICIIDCGTSWLEEIKENVKANNHEFNVIKLDEIKDSDFKLFSGIIISGAPILLTKVDPKEYMDSLQFVKDINIPIMGICFGHQIIGLLYGSKIQVGDSINKMEQIEIFKENNLFTSIENQSLFREEHCEYISLPDNFILLAKSESCDNEGMKHPNKIIYSTQFHPEASGSNGKKLFNNFLELCK